MRVALVAFAVLRFGLRLELGPEFDSNANRPEVGQGKESLAPPVAAFLLRSTARGWLRLSSGASSLRVNLDAGDKWFFAGTGGEDGRATSERRAQDEAVVRLGVEASHRFGERLALSLAGDYWDAFQWNDCPHVPITDVGGNQLFGTSCHRDFRSLGLRAFGSIADGIPGLTLEAGVRSYRWKPDDDLSFLGVGGAATPSARLRFGDAEGSDEGEVRLAMTGRIEWRRYHGLALPPSVSGCRFLGSDPTPICDGGPPRLPGRGDLVASWGLTLSYLGPLLASVGYVIEADHSNTAGASFLYQALTMDLTVPLGWGLTAATRAQLLFFSVGALPSSLYVDDENRNMLLFDLSRELGAGLTLSARYSVFRNAAGASREYLRQLVYLGLTWAHRR